MQKRSRSILFLLTLCAALLVAATLAAAILTIHSWVLRAGGGSSGAPHLVLEATLGQPVVGLSFGHTVALGAGYYSAMAPVPDRTYLPLVLKTSQPICRRRASAPCSADRPACQATFSQRPAAPPSPLRDAARPLWDAALGASHLRATRTSTLTRFWAWGDWVLRGNGCEWSGVSHLRAAEDDASGITMRRDGPCLRVASGPNQKGREHRISHLLKEWKERDTMEVPERD